MQILQHSNIQKVYGIRMVLELQKADLQVVSGLTLKAECIPVVGTKLGHLFRPSLRKVFLAAQLNRTEGQLLVCSHTLQNTQNNQLCPCGV